MCERGGRDSTVKQRALVRGRGSIFGALTRASGGAVSVASSVAFSVAFSEHAFTAPAFEHAFTAPCARARLYGPLRPSTPLHPLHPSAPLRPLRPSTPVRSLRPSTPLRPLHAGGYSVLLSSFPPVQLRFTYIVTSPPHEFCTIWWYQKWYKIW